ncbi:hypothetical protein F4604DRAFT_1917635 [Suillus subluteus]|nr:hypothetical protein F4604DRAFT_1917635 [Suillus subluteus]
MRLLLVTTLALSQALAALSQYAEAAFQVSICSSSTCEDKARQSGLPTDGWEIVFRDGGRSKCRRVTAQELEICCGTEYIDADTRAKMCCEDVSGLTWIDRPANLAKCCAKDQVWMFDNGDDRTRGGCCMVGLQLYNGNCVPPRPQCPPGTYSIDDRCVPIVSPPRCLPGTYLVDGQCVPNIDPPSCCAPGTYLVDGQCVPNIDPPLRCPSGTYWNDGQCVRNIPPPPRCPSGTFLVDGQCVPNIDPPRCPSGTYWNDGQCRQNIPPPPRCPSGTYWNDGQCLQNIPPPPRCPSGTYWNDGQCRQNIPPPPRCPSGTYLADGQCVQNPNGNCQFGNCKQDGRCNGLGCVGPSYPYNNYPVNGYGNYL